MATSHPARSVPPGQGAQDAIARPPNGKLSERLDIERLILPAQRERRALTMPCGEAKMTRRMAPAGRTDNPGHSRKSGDLSFFQAIDLTA
jgi:hypothetical protein